MQRTVFSDPHRYIVLAKGRRCGGTLGAANYCLKRLSQGGAKILWVDTIQDNLTRYYQRYIEPIVRQIGPKYAKWNGQQKILRILDGYMDMRSAEKPENIEGFGYTDIILNEAGIILNNRYLWDNAIRPMVMDYAAKCYFVGTPKGKLDKSAQEHLFYTFFQRGNDPVNWPEWKSYQFSSYDNSIEAGGSIEKSEIDAMVADIASIKVRQEIYADFVQMGQDSLFHDDWWVYRDTVPEYTEGLNFKMLSLDTAFKIGETNDFSAGTVWFRTNKEYCCVDMIQGRWTFPELIEKVKEIYVKWDLDLVLIEDRASGQSLIQSLQLTTLPVMPYSPDKDKITRATAITPLVESGRVTLVKGHWNKALTDQCSLFPDGEYDDIVDTISMALAHMKTSLDLGLRPAVSSGRHKTMVFENEDSPLTRRGGGKGEPVLQGFWD
jgi:predicted phage terminase large subunit-like protein